MSIRANPRPASQPARRGGGTPRREADRRRAPGRPAPRPAVPRRPVSSGEARAYATSASRAARQAARAASAASLAYLAADFARRTIADPWRAAQPSQVEVPAIGWDILEGPLPNKPYPGVFDAPKSLYYGGYQGSFGRPWKVGQWAWTTDTNFNANPGKTVQQGGYSYAKWVWHADGKYAPLYASSTAYTQYYPHLLARGPAGEPVPPLKDGRLVEVRPSVMPEPTPETAPAPDPVPVRRIGTVERWRRVLEPHPEGLPRRETPPQPQPFPEPEPQPEPNPSPRPRPRPRPVTDRLPAVVISPGRPARPAPRHRYKPPRKGERERKGAVSPSFRSAVEEYIRRAMNNGTEALDFVDALYEALPDTYQRKDATPQEKLAKLYERWRDIDMGEAIKNIVANAIEDRVYARASRDLLREMRRYNGGRGFEGWGPLV